MVRKLSESQLTSLFDGTSSQQMMIYKIVFKLCESVLKQTRKIAEKEKGMFSLGFKHNSWGIRIQHFLKGLLFFNHLI